MPAGSRVGNGERYLVVGHSHGRALADALAVEEPGSRHGRLDLRRPRSPAPGARLARFLQRAARKALGRDARERAAAGVIAADADSATALPPPLVGRPLRELERAVGGAVALLLRRTRPIAAAALPQRLAAEGITLLATVGGNAHNALALVELEEPFDFLLPGRSDLAVDPARSLVPFAAIEGLLRRRLARSLQIIGALRDLAGGRLVVIESPPPIGDDAHIRHWSGPWFREHFGEDWKVVPPTLRYKLWRASSAIYAEACRRHGIVFAPAPATVMVDGMFLRPEGWPENATHGNAWYGERVIAAVAQRLADAVPGNVAAPADREPGVAAAAPVEADHPYKSLPASSYWRRSVAAVAANAIDPVGDFPFRISRSTRVVTAGSCFAQHISRHLAKSGFAFHVTEPGNPLLDDAMRKEFQYGVFSARYGNVYTARQLLQLARRAFGSFTPAEPPWRDPAGRFLDPFRPAIQPGGFASHEELQLDRSVHLAAVRRAFRELDVMVFTLGLTECFVARADGAVFPVCPGVAGGEFSAARYEFRNFGVAEVVADLEAFFALLAAENPRFKAILTVSPVPLIATAEPRHVLQSTTWSKAVLRVAAGELARADPRIAYFPSYEIVTGAHARGAYFAEDLREVTEAGVEHVMRLFFAHATDARSGAAAGTLAPVPAITKRLRVAEEAVRVICEEELLDGRRE